MFQQFTIVWQVLLKHFIAENKILIFYLLSFRNIDKLEQMFLHFFIYDERINLSPKKLNI